MNVVPILSGSKGADTDTVLTAASAAALAKQGVTFVVRYLGSVTPEEIVAITSAGVGVSLVTFSRAPGWMPTAALGASDGATDVARLKALGVPTEMVVWIDLEGSGGSAADTAAWVNVVELDVWSATRDVSRVPAHGHRRSRLSLRRLGGAHEAGDLSPVPRHGGHRRRRNTRRALYVLGSSLWGRITTVVFRR
jgi:hypothetical protein